MHPLSSPHVDRKLQQRSIGIIGPSQANPGESLLQYITYRYYYPTVQVTSGISDERASEGPQRPSTYVCTQEQVSADSRQQCKSIHGICTSRPIPSHPTSFSPRPRPQLPTQPTLFLLATLSHRIVNISCRHYPVPPVTEIAPHRPRCLQRTHAYARPILVRCERMIASPTEKKMKRKVGR